MSGVLLLQVQQRIQKYLKDFKQDESLGYAKILTNVRSFITEILFNVRVSTSTLAGCYNVDPRRLEYLHFL